MLVFVLHSVFVPRSEDNPRDYVANSGLHRDRYYRSIEALPRWIQERYAVMRLLEEFEPSPLGKWSIGGRGFEDETLYLYIVRQPGDPEWEE